MNVFVLSYSLIKNELMQQEMFAKKTFLGNDSGINDALAELRFLEAQEGMIVNALTYDLTRRIVECLGGKLLKIFLSKTQH